MVLEGTKIAVRIKDVAEKSGVSVSTVSRVLNGGMFVKEEVKERVQQAINELGYTPSHIARSLVLKKTNLIGVIVPDISNSFFGTLLSSIEEYASKNNYNILVCNICENLGKELKYLSIFKEMRVDGIIIMHEKLDNSIREFLKITDTPMVMCSGRLSGVSIPSVNINDFQASYEAVYHLISLNHKKIALIGGEYNDSITGYERFMGYKKALEDNKLELNEQFIRFGNYKMSDGYELMNDILKGGQIPTAVYATSDDMAVGAINAIMDYGLKVPENISVVGFDDSTVASVVRPKLTTIHQPIREIGTLSMDLLLKQINQEELVVKDLVLWHKLVERNSCKAI